jgi:hypothetical protein
MPQVVAVQLDQVEGVQKDLAIVVPIPNAVEHREAVVVAGNCLGVDDARAAAQVSERLDNQWETVREIIARTPIEFHPARRSCGRRCGIRRA